MTDTLEPAATPRPVRRPAARSRPAPRMPNGQSETPVEELVRQNAMLLERLERLERGNPQFIESEPPPQPQSRVADDEELPTEWLRDLRHETKPKDPATIVRKEKNYNYRLRYFMRPDGDVVQLQGDPQNLAFYSDKCGFRLLSEEPGGEEEHYLKVERPKILKVQQKKAQLINGIRGAVARDTSLQLGLDPSWDMDLNKMTIPELQNLYDEIKNTPMDDGRPRRMFKRPERLQDADDRRAEAETARLLQGVEVGKKSRSELERLIEMTPENARSFA